jgi:hypothetical protein
MIDWFVLLSPLLVLPLVLLFAFIGCTNDYAPFLVDGHEAPRVRFRYGPGFQTGITKLTVEFEYQLDTEFTPDPLPSPDPLTQFDSSGGVVDQTDATDLGKLAPGWVLCSCKPEGPDVTTAVSFPGKQHNDGHQELGTFVFSRVGSSFQMTIDP